MKLLNKYHSDQFDLENRVVMAPMTRCRADNEEHAATDLIAEYYGQRATAGLIISEGTFVNEIGKGLINIPCIYSAAQVEGWKKVTKAVHDKGGKIFAQLWHVGRLANSEVLNGKQPVGPSAINGNGVSYTKDGFKATSDPRELSLAEIKETILDFQRGAVNAIEAGFDGVELHAANGYLFHQFFAKCSNKRTDEYGGSIENRQRFLFDVLDAIGEKIPLAKVAVRLAPTLEQTYGIELDDETEELFDTLVHKLNDHGLAYLHLSGFTWQKFDDPLPTILSTAKRFRKIYKGTLMINKGFTAATANQAIEDGIADLVSFGEPFIANPDLVERFATNTPLSTSDRDTYYTTGAKGYTDYPFYTQS